MAELLNDVEMRRILDSVIKDGVEDSVRPNSYVLRLGSQGEFLTTGKEFSLGRGAGDKKGIRVGPGESVALTAYELPAVQDRWLIGTGSLIAVLIGLGVTVFSSPLVQAMLATHGAWIGPILVAWGAAGGFRLARKRRRPERSEP